MQIGVIGLGRMGGNISRRLMKAGHHLRRVRLQCQAARGAGERGRHGCAVAGGTGRR